MEAHQKGLEEHPDRVKFLVQMEGEAQDEIIAYNDIINYLEAELSDDEKVWSLKGSRHMKGLYVPRTPAIKVRPTMFKSNGKTVQSHMNP